MIQDILIPFITVGLAELGDKTQLATFALASKTKKYFQLILGIILAFIIADGLAVIFGDVITRLIPMKYIKIIAGTIFIIFGIIILKNHKEKGKSYNLKNPFMSAFGLVLVSEMGDKTQIASALFATQFNPVFVFIGVIAALTILSIIAVYLGKFIAKKLPRKTISIAAGILFIIMGIFFFI